MRTNKVRWNVGEQGDMSEGGQNVTNMWEMDTNPGRHNVGNPRRRHTKREMECVYTGRRDTNERKRNARKRK